VVVTEHFNNTPLLLDVITWMPYRILLAKQRHAVEELQQMLIAFTGRRREAQMERHAPVSDVLILRNCSG